MGSIPQYLTSVFGGAYVIFRVPEGEAWDPVNDENMKTTDLSKPNSNVYYAKIPIKYVLDAVEAVNNESKMNAKRVPGVLDAGITWVGATYCGLGMLANCPQTKKVILLFAKKQVHIYIRIQTTVRMTLNVALFL